MSQKKLLFVNEYGIYPELVQALQSTEFTVTVEHLMRNAIKFIKKNDPDIVVAEFMHEPQFRDRVSNLESMLAQIEGRNKSRTIVIYNRDHQIYLDKVRGVFSIDTAMVQPVTAEQLLARISEIENS